MGLGNVNVTQGLAIFRSIDLDESEEAVKASPGSVFAIYASNAHATDARWLKLYDGTAASVVVGTTTPVATFFLPANGANPMKFETPHGMAFSTAITAAATTAAADADTGAPSANDVVVVILYR